MCLVDLPEVLILSLSKDEDRTRVLGLGVGQRMKQSVPARSGTRDHLRPASLSRRAELLILCARIGFNPPA